MRMKALKIQSEQCYGVNWIPFFFGRHCMYSVRRVTRFLLLNISYYEVQATILIDQ